MSIERLPFPLDYSSEQQAAIGAAWANRYTCRGVTYHRGVFFERTSRQLFAVFGTTAWAKAAGFDFHIKAAPVTYTDESGITRNLMGQQGSRW